jgi:hypothetical protein
MIFRRPLAPLKTLMSNNESEDFPMEIAKKIV